MKTTRWIAGAIAGAALALAGCSKQAVDTAPIENNFKSADATTQSAANNAVAAIKAQNYTDAMTQLKALLNNAKLTPEQKQAVTDEIAQVQKAISDAASKAASDAGKSAGDLQKNLGK